MVCFTRQLIFIKYDTSNLYLKCQQVFQHKEGHGINSLFYLPLFKNYIYNNTTLLTNSITNKPEPDSVLKNQDLALLL